MDTQQQAAQSHEIVQLKGELDAQSVAGFEAQYPNSFWQGSTAVVIDLSDVSFIDSSGVGMLVFLIKRLWANQRQVCLAGAQGQPARLLSMLRIQQSIPCYDTVPASLAALKGTRFPTSIVR